MKSGDATTAPPSGWHICSKCGNAINNLSTSGWESSNRSWSESSGGTKACGDCKYKPRDRAERRKLDSFIEQMRKNKFK